MSEQRKSDLLFDDYVLPPMETFADTMRLRYGWSRPDRSTLERYRSIADSDNVDQQLELMTRFAAATYRHFGGGEDTLPLPVDLDDVLEFVSNPENQNRFMCWGFEEEIAGLAHKYLSGQGEDYESFHQIW